MVLLTEAIMEAKDLENPIFLDTSKAFDIVYQTGLLCARNGQCVHGPLWHLYRSVCKNIQSSVNWEGQVSYDRRI